MQMLNSQLEQRPGEERSCPDVLQTETSLNAFGGRGDKCSVSPVSNIY